MTLITKKPVTQSQRNLIKLNTKHLNKTPILKNKLKGLKNSSGRNNSGKITIRHKGNGHKKKFRKINFNRIFKSIGITISIEYDPNRNANIAAIYNFNTNSFFYILAPKDLNIGDIIKSGVNHEPKIGYSIPISNIPIGSYIHNISPKVSKFAQISRAAGTFSILKEKTLDYAKIKLSSGETRFISPNCYATIGIVSNEFTFLTQLGKAGQSRWLNRRPTVRGVAMNPVDHPHGGGEGKKSGKGKTPWGKNVRKGRTSKSKNKLIINKK
jgi:large subunit ribosomal protein L2